MSTINVALLGLGTVGQGVYETIYSHQDQLTSLLGKKVVIRAILIKNKEKDRKVESDIIITDNFEDILQLPELDIVLEAIGGNEPSFTYLSKAIAKGCNVITANKEMFAHHGIQLQELALQHDVSIRFEATVAGGVPIIQTLQQLINVNRIYRIQGILNGTSNFILSSMREQGIFFMEALTIAQQKGYAEADPTNDIEGYDAFYKLMVLSQVAFGIQPKWDNIARNGIAAITIEQLEFANQMGLRFKHIAEIEKTNDGIIGWVRPVLVTPTHPFYNIEGVDNAVAIYSDIVGNITLQGPGAGKLPTASAMVEDLVQIIKNPGKTKSIENENNTFQRKSSSNNNWLIFNPNGYNRNQLNKNKLEIQSNSTDKAALITGLEEDIKNLTESCVGITYYPVYGNFKNDVIIQNRTAV